MGSVLSFFRPARVAQGDWSQQEFAEFYRVEAALTQAGLHVTGEPGVSDEGDPWFVFCRFDGEVILHFARIDGLYVVASEAFERPLQGSDFRSLLNTVAEQHPTLVPIPRPSAARAGGKLVLHPAALLAAIVATVAFQLAGGDAIAGEMATAGGTPPASGSSGDGSSSESALAADGPAAAEVDLGGHRDASRDHGIEDDGRHARHALILTAMALVSTMLSNEHGAGVRTPDFGETVASASEKLAVSEAPEAVNAFLEGPRQRANASEASLLTRQTVMETAGGRPTFVSPGGTIPAGTLNAQITLEGFNLATANVLDLGAAGGQEFAVVRSAETAFLGGWMQGAHKAPRAGSVTASAEKAAVPPSGSEGASPSSASTASGSSATTVGAHSTASAHPVSPSVAGPDSDGNAVVVRSLGLTDSHPAAVSTASPPLTAPEAGRSVTSAVSATVQTAQSASVATVTYTISNTEARSALSTFLSQHAMSGDADGTAASAAGAIGAIASTIPWYRAWASTVGSSGAAEVLATLVAQTRDRDTGAELGGTNATGTVGLTDKTSAKLDSAGPLSISATSGTESGTKAGSTVELGADGADHGTIVSAAGVTVASNTTGGHTALAGPGAASPTTGADGSGAVVVAVAPTQTTPETPGAHTALTIGTGAAGSTTGKDSPAAVVPVIEAAGAHAGKATSDTTSTQTGLGSGAGTPAVSTHDTVAAGKSAFVASASVLDDRARELIARFLDTTTQVQTIVTDHSFVMIDMDATHYASPDFALRSWSISPDVEISIIGLTSDSYLGHGSGFLG